MYYRQTWSLSEIPMSIVTETRNIIEKFKRLFYFIFFITKLYEKKIEFDPILRASASCFRVCMTASQYTRILDTVTFRNTYTHSHTHTSWQREVGINFIASLDNMLKNYIWHTQNFISQLERCLYSIRSEPLAFLTH